MKKSNNHLRELVVAIGISLVFAVSYSTIAIRKYDAHQTRGDLTAYAQGLWNTLHGHFMASTFNYSVHNFWDGHFREITPQNSNIFGIHFNPIILLLLPFYAIYPHPVTLIVLQALVLASSSIIIFNIAKRSLQNQFLSYIIQFSYLLHVAIVSASMSEFHAYPLTVLFSALLVWFSRSKQNAPYFLSLLLLLLVQENAAIPALFFGFYLLLSKDTRQRGLVTSIAGILYLLATTKLIIPVFSPTRAYLFEGSYGSKLGGSYIQMAINSLRHPSLLFSTLFTSDNMQYLFKILLPIFPFALFAPTALIAGILTLTPNLISTAGILRSLTMHYEAVSTPYLYYALILGLATFLRYVKTTWHNLVKICLIVIIILATSLQYKLITSIRFSPRCVWSCRFYSPLDAEKDQVIALIPSRVSVSTQDYLSGHLSGRSELYLFPVYFDRADYVVISKGTEIWPLNLEDHLAYLTKLKDNQSHTVSLETDHFIVFKKNP